MFEGERCDAGVDALPDGHRRNRAQFVGGNLDGDIERTTLPCLDNLDFIAAGAAKKLRDQFDRVLRSGKTNT